MSRIRLPDEIDRAEPVEHRRVYGKGLCTAKLGDIYGGHGHTEPVDMGKWRKSVLDNVVVVEAEKRQ